MNTPLVNQTLPSFDDLMELALHHPEAFDQLKHDMCEEMILSASEQMQDRLWAQQSHIDRVISHCKNPNHANMALMRELVLQISKFQLALDGQENTQVKEQKAQIIPLDDWR